MCRRVFVVVALCLFLATTVFGGEPDSVKVRLADSLTSEVNLASSPEMSALLYYQIAELYIDSDLSKVLHYAKLAEVEAAQIKNDSTRAMRYADIGIHFHTCCIYDEALKLFVESEKLFKAEGNYAKLHIVKHNIGSIYAVLEEYDKSLECFKGALNTYRERLAQGDSSYYRYEFVFYGNIGNAYTNLGDLENAEKYLLVAVDLIKRNEEYPETWSQYNMLALVYLKKQDYNKAFYFLEKALQYAVRHHNKFGEAQTLYQMGNLLFYQKFYEGAKQNLLKSLEISAEINSVELLSKNYSLLFLTYKALGDFASAVAMVERKDFYRDSLFNDKLMNRTSSLKLKYEFSNIQLQREAEMKTTVLYYKLIFVCAISILIILVLLYLFLRMRSKKILAENSNLKTDLSVKTTELGDNVIYLQRRTELLSGILVKLQGLLPRMKPENKEIIQSVIADIKVANQNEEWVDFNKKFLAIHTDFCNKLSAVSDELTATELKICTFIHMKMSSKEIAAVLNIETRSVTICRYRIRKKLRITHTDSSLSDFLVSL